MSADNWAICPICKIEREKLYKEKYGKVTAKEYDELIDQYRNEEGKFDTETVREDYNGGPYFDSEGNWVFSGGACCDVCGTVWEIDIRAKPQRMDEYRKVYIVAYQKNV